MPDLKAMGLELTQDQIKQNGEKIKTTYKDAIGAMVSVIKLDSDDVT